MTGWTLSDLADVLAERARRLGDGLAEAGRLAFRAAAGAGHYLRPSGRYIRHETLRQIRFTAVEGLPAILRAGLSLGLLIAFALLSLGVESPGALVRALDVSLYANLIPILAAFIVIGRSGAALTSDIATFRIGRTVEAFAAMNLEPHHFTVLPRIVGVTLSLLILTFWMGLAVSVTAILVHLTFNPVSATSLFAESARLLQPAAIALTLLKVAIFGASIAVIHCMYGLRARAVIDIARNIPPAFVVASSWCMGVAVLIDIAANV